MGKVRLICSDGIRLDDSSRQLRLTLDGQICERKLAATERLDLPSSPLREYPAPHGHGLSGTAKRVSEGLMSAPEVLNDLLECHHGENLNKEGQASRVSMLPLSVKRLTSRRKRTAGNLAYMSSKRAPKDPWAIARGKAMAAARKELGYSQAKIASLSGIKDRETVSQYESGMITDIDPAVVPRLAKALGMRVEDLSRNPINSRDEGADLRVSPVARHIAYNWDDFPLGLQNAIRHQIANFEQTVKDRGRGAALALYGDAAKPPDPMPVPMRRARSR